MPDIQIIKFAFIVAAVATVLYLPILSADFVYDDVSQILIDNYIHKPAHFAEVLSLSVMRKDILDNNRPAMVLSLMIDSLLWGHNPLGYHLTNLLLHSLCSAMVFLLLYGVLGRLFAENDKNIGALWAAFFMLFMLVLAEQFPAERKMTNILLGGLIAISISVHDKLCSIASFCKMRDVVFCHLQPIRPK